MSYYVVKLVCVVRWILCYPVELIICSHFYAHSSAFSSPLFLIFTHSLSPWQLSLWSPAAKTGLASPDRVVAEPNPARSVTSQLWSHHHPVPVSVAARILAHPTYQNTFWYPVFSRPNPSAGLVCPSSRVAPFLAACGKCILFNRYQD